MAGDSDSIRLTTPLSPPREGPKKKSLFVYDLCDNRADFFVYDLCDNRADFFVYDLCDNRAGFFVYDLCDNRTEEGYPYIKANNVASPRIHPSYDIFYLVLFWYAAWLHTAWSCGY